MESLSTTLPVTDVKQRLLELLKKVELYHEVVTITRNGHPAGVMMGIDDFQSLLETVEILSDPQIMKSLGRSRRQSKKAELYSDDEVWD